MRATNPPAERTERNPLRSFAEGIGYVRTEAVIATLLLLETVLNFFGSFNPMLVVYAKDIFGVGAEGYGLLQSAGGAGTVAGSLALGAMGDVHHKGRLLIAGGVAFGLAVIGFAFCPWFHLALMLLAVAGAADIMMGATRTTIIQLLTRGDMLGRVMSLHAVSTRGIGPSGGFQTGALATVVGVPIAVATGAMICITATLLVGWKVPTVREFTGTGRRAGGSSLPAGRRPLAAEEVMPG
jgi:MFS family permease